MQELKSLNNTLKQKLEEAQKNLESNVQMIAWLNKQLNEKPGIGGSMLPPPSFGKVVTTVGSGMTKPPISSVTASFKPTFASIDQLNSSGTAVAGGSTTSFERSPYRNLNNAMSQNNNLLNTPSSVSSTSSISNSFIQQTVTNSSAVSLKNQKGTLNSN